MSGQSGLPLGADAPEMRHEVDLRKVDDPFLTIETLLSDGVRAGPAKALQIGAIRDSAIPRASCWLGLRLTA